MPSGSFREALENYGGHLDLATLAMDLEPQAPPFRGTGGLRRHYYYRATVYALAVEDSRVYYVGEKGSG